MSSLSYYALWLGLALVAVGIASAMITRHLRLREQRCSRAEEMLDALTRYSEWVAAQRRCAAFRGQPQGTPLQQARAVGSAWFPELSADMGRLASLHDALVEFLECQQQLRLQDPEVWLELDHDARFMDLWRSHSEAVHRVAERLRLAARPVIDPEPESIYPA